MVLAIVSAEMTEDYNFTVPHVNNYTGVYQFDQKRI